jgi:hypothetical protein
MKMSDVRPGMRLKAVDVIAAGSEEIEVTSLTERGFAYRIPDDRPLVHPHWSMPISRDGHEHFGIKGETFYEVMTAIQQGTPSA